MRLAPSVLAIAALIAARAAFAQDLLVQCRSLVIAPDATVEPAEMLVRDGKVLHLGREIPAETRARARAIVFADATITPGFVLATSALGQEADLCETAVPMTPELLAVEAFDPFHEDLAHLPAAGCTSCALSPSSRNVAGGIAALVKPGVDHGRARVDEIYARFSLSQLARNPERAPTSLMGAVDLLREAFLVARNGTTGGPDVKALGAVLRGERRAFIAANGYAEIRAALDLATEFAFEPVLLGAGSADECLDRIAAARAAVVLAPLVPEQSDERLRLPAQFEHLGIPFCFVGRPDQLRATAALAVRHGASRKAALAALTRTPAELCGQAAVVGSLRRGCDADFCVWTGDPLDLSSALVAVFVDGALVHGKAPSPTTPAPDLAAAKEVLR